MYLQFTAVLAFGPSRAVSILGFEQSLPVTDRSGLLRSSGFVLGHRVHIFLGLAKQKDCNFQQIWTAMLQEGVMAYWLMINFLGFQVCLSGVLGVPELG
jgi:hypothetical protein